jgi:hypothetical protein
MISCAENPVHLHRSLKFMGDFTLHSSFLVLQEARMTMYADDFTLYMTAPKVTIRMV